MERDEVIGRLRALELDGGSHANLSAIAAAILPDMTFGWTRGACEGLRDELVRLISEGESAELERTKDDLRRTKARMVRALEELDRVVSERDDGFWLDVMGEPEPRTCGNCRYCERFKQGRSVLYDPWSEMDEPLRSTLRGVAGICTSDGAVGVMLDSPCKLCEGDGWEESA